MSPAASSREKGVKDAALIEAFASAVHAADSE